MMDLKDVFCNRVYNRKLIQIALPITLQNLMMALVAAADALMLGLVGQDAMAAVSLATQIQFIQSVLLTAIATGVSVLGAQYWGKKDKDVLGWIFGLGVRESLIVSLPFFAGCFFIPEM